MHYNYVHATMNGEQLPYIPEQSIGGTIGITYKTFSLDYNQTYTGKRYILSDDSELLLPFQVSNLVIAKQLHLSKAQLKVFLRMNNLFNESYSSIAWYPMPMRNYQVGLSITFHSPTAHQSILN